MLLHPSQKPTKQKAKPNPSLSYWKKGFVYCFILVCDCVIFKALVWDVAVSPSDFKDLSFCPTSGPGCKNLLLILVQLPSPCLLLGNRRKVKKIKTFCAPSPVQGFIAFDFWETKWACVRFINFSISEAASVAQLVGTLGCYPFLFKCVSLYSLWDRYSRKGEIFFTSSSSSSTVSTLWVLQSS